MHAAPRPGDRRPQSRRLLLLNVGVVSVVIGVPAQLWPLVVAGASALAVAVGWHGAFLIGGQFDTVDAEGAYLLREGDGGSQSLALGPAQGGFVELEFP